MTQATLFDCLPRRPRFAGFLNHIQTMPYEKARKHAKKFPYEKLMKQSLKGERELGRIAGKINSVVCGTKKDRSAAGPVAPES